MNKPRSPQSVNRTRSSMSNISESSPLQKDNAGSFRARRRSTAEKIAIGVQRAIEAFEFEVIQPTGSDELSDSMSGFEDDYIDNHTYQRPNGCLYKMCSIVCLALFFMIFFFFGVWTCQLATPEIPTRGDTTMAALKADSFIEQLENGAVAADHAICSEVGNTILQDGGNAVDAAVATTLCLGVANPASSGLGGGAFILIHSDRENHETRASALSFPAHHDKRDPNFELEGDKVTEVIDCRETAPGAATEDMFLSKPDSVSAIGGLSVAVPGELRGLELAHARHGKLPWADVLAPAIKLAQDGIPVSAHLAFEIRITAEARKKNGGGFSKLRRYVTKDDDWDSPLKEGDVLKNEMLAKTLRLVADKGSAALYEGQLAKDIVNEVGEEGGILTEADLSGYQATLRTPVFGEAFGYNFVGVPPPSSGGAVIFGALRFLSGYETPLAGDKSTLSVHRMCESLRHTFAIRMSLCDPDFFSNTTNRAVHDLVSGTYMESLRKVTLDNGTLPLSMYGGPSWAQLHDTDGQKEAEDAHEGDRLLRRNRRLARPFGYLEDFGTSHLSVVDKDGNAVAITTSVNLIFGSAVFSEKTGIVLGDTMDDFGNPGAANFFGLKPSPENFIAPGKKPLSSMSPTLVFRKTQESSTNSLGKLALAVGGSGGPKIITSVLQVVINHLLVGMDLFDSIARPRVHEQLIYHGSAVTTTEKSQSDQGQRIEVPQITKDALLRRGRASVLDIDYAGTVQAISIDLETNTLSAASDIRKGGRPAGY